MSGASALHRARGSLTGWTSSCWSRSSGTPASSRECTARWLCARRGVCRTGLEPRTSRGHPGRSATHTCEPWYSHACASPWTGQLTSHPQLFSTLELCPATTGKYRTVPKETLNIAESRLLAFAQWLPKKGAEVERLTLDTGGKHSNPNPNPNPDPNPSPNPNPDPEPEPNPNPSPNPNPDPDPSPNQTSTATSRPTRPRSFSRSCPA